MMIIGWSDFSSYALDTNKPTQKRIALTFDDGPHPRQTREILDVLDKYGVKATFFVIGVNVQNYPGIITEVLRRGHEIGNHSNTHSHADKLNETTFRNEISTCENAIFKETGKQSRLFRPPEGAINENSGLLSCLDRFG